MTTYEQLRVLDQLIAALDSESELETLLLAISGNLDPATEFVNAAALSADSSQAYTNSQQLKNHIEGVVEQIRTLGPGNVYIRLSDWMRRLEAIQPEKHDAPDSELTFYSAASVLLAEARAFFEQFDTFVKQPIPSQTLRVISRARSLLATIAFGRLFLKVLRVTLNPTVEVAENEREVSLFFSAAPNFHDVVVKLRALEQVYQELSQLLGVSTTQFPLRIVKVEAGSLWLRLIGESRVIGLMISLIERSVSYMYRNFTDEGKLVNLPRQVEAAEAVLRLREKLEASNIDTSKMKENLEKSGVIISERLNDLLVGEPRVEVDGKAHSVGDEFEQKFLNESRMLFLEAGNENETANTPNDEETN